MEPSDEFEDWWEFHVRAFGLTDDQARGVAAWRETFADMGYTREDLMAASKELLREVPGPRFLTDHRDRLHSIIAVRRQYATKAKDAETVDYGSCDRCSGSGWVMVPHPEYVQGGDWKAIRFNAVGMPVRPMASVTCTCYCGKKNLNLEASMNQPNKPGHKKRPMTLEFYRDHVHADPWALEKATRAKDDDAKPIGRKPKPKVKVLSVELDTTPALPAPPPQRELAPVSPGEGREPDEAECPF